MFGEFEPAAGGEGDFFVVVLDALGDDLFGEAADAEEGDMDIAEDAAGGVLLVFGDPDLALDIEFGEERRGDGPRHLVGLFVEAGAFEVKEGFLFDDLLEDEREIPIGVDALVLGPEEFVVVEFDDLACTEAEFFVHEDLKVFGEEDIAQIGFAVDGESVLEIEEHREDSARLRRDNLAQRA